MGAPDALCDPEGCALAPAAPADLLDKISGNAEAVEAVESFALGDEPALCERGFGSGQGQWT